MKCKSDFFEVFQEFAKNTSTYLKIDTVIEKQLILKQFVPMLKRFYPDNHSLGLRTRNIMNTDFLKLTRLYHLKNIEDIQYQVKLVKEDIRYIDALDKLQNK